MLKIFLTIWTWIKDWYTEYLGDPIKELFFKVFPAKHQRAYLKSLLMHKYYVFQAGMELGVPIWQLIIHDWSKFLPDEFNPYADNFFNQQLKDDERENLPIEYTNPSDPMLFGIWVQDRFLVAWDKHQKRNPHHWQYWYLIQDNDPWMPLPIPEKYAKEMVADWAGAGRTYTGKWEVLAWYTKNKDKILLHPITRDLVEELIENFHMEE